MVFDKIADQKTKQVLCKLSGGLASWKVGDLFAYVPSTKIAEKITTLAAAEAADIAGKKLYLIAQSDGVTEKTGTPYKTYTINDTVKMNTTEKIVVAYEVEDYTNIIGYEG